MIAHFLRMIAQFFSNEVIEPMRQIDELRKVLN